MEQSWESTRDNREVETYISQNTLPLNIDIKRSASLKSVENFEQIFKTDLSAENSLLNRQRRYYRELCFRERELDSRGLRSKISNHGFAFRHETT